MIGSRAIVLGRLLHDQCDASIATHCRDRIGCNHRSCWLRRDERSHWGSDPLRRCRAARHDAEGERKGPRPGGRLRDRNAGPAAPRLSRPADAQSARYSYRVVLRPRVHQLWE
eukprot:1315963-Prymnesium_polylepis.1